MAFKFTFQTEHELLCKELQGDINTFNIVRVTIKKPNGFTWDYPIKTKESLDNFFLNLETSENEFLKMYPAKHGFERVFEMD